MIYHLSSLARLTYLALFQAHQRGPQPSHGVPFRAAAGARVAFADGAADGAHQCCFADQSASAVSVILLEESIVFTLAATMRAACLSCHRPRMLICAPCFQGREATFLVNKVHHTFRERGAEPQTS